MIRACYYFLVDEAELFHSFFFSLKIRIFFFWFSAKDWKKKIQITFLCHIFFFPPILQIFCSFSFYFFFSFRFIDFFLLVFLFNHRDHLMTNLIILFFLKRKRRTEKKKKYREEREKRKKEKEKSEIKIFRFFFFVWYLFIFSIKIVNERVICI